MSLKSDEYRDQVYDAINRFFENKPSPLEAANFLTQLHDDITIMINDLHNTANEMVREYKRRGLL